MSVQIMNKWKAVFGADLQVGGCQVGMGFIEGSTSFEGTNYGREVNLYAEQGTDRGAPPGNLTAPTLVWLAKTFSDPVTGAFRFDNLYRCLTYTTIAIDGNGLWDPAIKSGWSVTPY